MGMILDKAKEILDTHQAQLAFNNAPDLRNAIKLGIAAIERIQAYRRLHVQIDPMKLPGED